MLQAGRAWRGWARGAEAGRNAPGTGESAKTAVQPGPLSFLSPRNMRLSSARGHRSLAVLHTTPQVKTRRSVLPSAEQAGMCDSQRREEKEQSGHDVICHNAQEVLDGMNEFNRRMR